MGWRTGAIAVLAAVAAGCGGGAPEPAVDPPGSAPEPSREAAGPAYDGPTFVDVAARAGVDRVVACGNADKKHLLESTGTGVAIADYDGDGDLDLYVPTAQTTDDWLAGRRPRTNALYRNEGDGTFVDVAAEAGVALAAWSAGAYFADYDNDGDPDLFVTTWGPDVLYRNEGDGTFVDVTARAGVAGPADGWSASAAFGDLDGDGDLDLYVTQYCEYDLNDPPFGGEFTEWKGIRVYRGPMGFTAQPDRLYRNDGNGTFTDVSRESGIAHRAAPLYGLGVVLLDVEDDGDLDVYVANDSVENTLFRNEGGLRFEEVGSVAGVATNEDARPQAGMGTDAGDYDGDGAVDLIVTNFSHDWNTLYRNVGNGLFVDATFQAGLRDSYLPLAWGTKFFDYDNDGALDLFVANGHIYPWVDDNPQLNTRYREPNLLYRNRGDGRLDNVTAAAGPGLAIVEGTRGAAVADLDGDGDLDLVLTNCDSTPNLLINRGGETAAWLAVRLVGTKSDRDGTGARISARVGDRILVREANPYGSYLSSSGFDVHLGLGEATSVDVLTVRWPSGAVDRIENVPARQVVTVTEGAGITAEEAPR